MLQTLEKEGSIHDKIAALVSQKFDELSAQLPDLITGRKIIAGFVMSRKLKSGEMTFQVVSIGSGEIFLFSVGWEKCSVS